MLTTVIIFQEYFFGLRLWLIFCKNLSITLTTECKKWAAEFGDYGVETER